MLITIRCPCNNYSSWIDANAADAGHVTCVPCGDNVLICTQVLLIGEIWWGDLNWDFLQDLSAPDPVDDGIDDEDERRWLING